MRRNDSTGSSSTLGELRNGLVAPIRPQNATFALDSVPCFLLASLASLFLQSDKPSLTQAETESITLSKLLGHFQALHGSDAVDVHQGESRWLSTTMCLPLP